MGCFNHTGNFSHLPIKYGDRIVVIVGLQRINTSESLDNFAIGHSFVPFTLPIRGTYNDYGSIEQCDCTAMVMKIKDIFGIDAETLVDCAERVSCDCEDRVEDNLNKIYSVFERSDSKLYPEFSKKHYKLGYVMEHEDIFNKMCAMNDTSFADHVFWYGFNTNILTDLGYKHTQTIPDPSYSSTSGRTCNVWEHEKYPALQFGGYLWLQEEYGDYNNIIKTLKVLCDKIGIDVPEKYNISYYEGCFNNDIKIVSDIETKVKRELHEMIEDGRIKANDDIKEIENDIRFVLNCTENRNRSAYSFTCSFIANSFFGDSDRSHAYNFMFDIENNEHISEKYRDEFVNMSNFYGTMHTLQLTWGNTHYAGQESRYDKHIEFLESCLNFEKNKKQEFIDEYGDEE